MKACCLLSMVILLAGAVACAATKPVVLVKGTYTIQQKGSEAGAVGTFFDTVAGPLRAAGVDFEALGDEDVEAGKLAGAKLAIFPYNPNMSPGEAKAAVDFLAAGGKVFACYSTRGELLTALGFKSTGRKAGGEFEGKFATCRAVLGAIAGMPESFRQDSWNINGAEPARDDAKMACEWVDTAGQPTGIIA